MLGPDREGQRVVGTEITSVIEGNRREVLGSHDLPQLEAEASARDRGGEAHVGVVTDQRDRGGSQIEGRGPPEIDSVGIEDLTETIQEKAVFLDIVGIACHPDGRLHPTGGREWV